MTKNFNYAYRKNSNTLVNANDVDNGNKCDCICPQCEGELTAYNNGKKRVPHFKHKQNKNCDFNNESLVHLFAKEYFESLEYLYIPLGYYTFEINSSEIYNETIINNSIFNKKLKIKEVKLEKQMDNIKPDIIIKIEHMDKVYEILVEIAVTHFIDEKKQIKLNNLNKNCIEIDLSGFKKELNEISKDKLFKYLKSECSYENYKVVSQFIYNEIDFINIANSDIKNKLLNKTIKIPMNNMKKISFSYNSVSYCEVLDPLDRDYIEFEVKDIKFNNNIYGNFSVFNGKKWLEIILYYHNYCNTDMVDFFKSKNRSAILFFVESISDVSYILKNSKKELNHYWVYNLAEENAIAKVKEKFKNDFGNNKSIWGAFSRRDFTFERFYKTK